MWVVRHQLVDERETREIAHGVVFSPDAIEVLWAVGLCFCFVVVGEGDGGGFEEERFMQEIHIALPVLHEGGGMVDSIAKF